MKIRMKFSKEGRIKFVGHLDLLRLFERAIKVAKIPIAYSQGYNPHSLMYFAQALSVGITSEGEYLDLHLAEAIETEWVKKQMNNILPQGLKIQEVYILLEGSKTCMALIDGSSYIIAIPKNNRNNGFIEQSNEFYKQDEVLVTRKSKKKERVINIKEFICQLEIGENKTDYIIEVVLLTGSRKNLNAKLFIDAFIENTNLEIGYQIHRKELFSFQDELLVPLWKIGV